MLPAFGSILTTFQIVEGPRKQDGNEKLLASMKTLWLFPPCQQGVRPPPASVRVVTARSSADEAVYK